MWSTAIPAAFYEKSPVNFGPQTKKFYWLELSHLSGFFGGDYISPHLGCCPLEVLYALEIDQALIARTQMRMGFPKKLLIATFRPIVKIFGTKIAERTSFSAIYSFFTSPNLCQRTTVLIKSLESLLQTNDYRVM